MRPPGAERELGGVSALVQLDLGALGQLPHDVVERVDGGGGGAGLADRGLDRVDDGDVHVGRGQGQAPLLGADQHVRQDRDGVAALDDVLDVGQGAEQDGALDGQFHGRLGRSRA